MHYSVLIVDDDRRIRSGLINSINWNDMGFVTPEQADSVASALSLFSRQRVDVLITDIRMPGGSGLELSQKVSAMYPKTVILVLSGFSDFEYAQQAIQYGVKHYLTKPTDLVQFRVVLSDVYNRLEQERKAVNRITEIEKRYNQTVQLLIEQLCIDISYGTVRNDTSFKNFLEENRIVFPYTFYCVAACELNKKPASKQYDDAYLLDLLTNFITMHFKAYEIVFYTYRMNGYSINILFNYNDPQLLRQAVDQLHINCAQILNLEILMVISGATTNLEGVAECYNQIHQLSKDVNTAKHPADGAEENSVEEALPLWDSSYIKEATHQLLAYISSCEEIKAFNLVDRLFSHSGTAPIDYFQDLFMRLLFAVEQHITYYNLQLSEIWGSQMIKNAQKLQSVDEIGTALKDCITQIIASLEKSRTSFSYKLVDQIKRYIEDHYKDDISLYSASEIVHLSPSYISKIFKKSTGYNFVEYLTSVRINKAKELLANTSIKVYEVAEVVGYKSTKHFSMVFKGQVGVTPLNYKKSVFQK